MNNIPAAIVGGFMMLALIVTLSPIAYEAVRLIRGW